MGRKFLEFGGWGRGVWEVGSVEFEESSWGGWPFSSVRRRAKSHGSSPSEKGPSQCGRCSGGTGKEPCFVCLGPTVQSGMCPEACGEGIFKAGDGLTDLGLGLYALVQERLPSLRTGLCGLETEEKVGAGGRLEVRRADRRAAW